MALKSKTTKGPNSAQLLENLWQSFRRHLLRETQTPVSKRTVSKHHLLGPHLSEGADASQLAKWTNTGERYAWRIPLNRVEHTVSVLRGNQHDVDRIMLARVSELRNHSRNSEVPAAVDWAMDFARRQLNSDEQWLLKQLREKSAGYRGALFNGAHHAAFNKTLMESLLEFLVEREIAEDQLIDQAQDDTKSLDQDKVDRVFARVSHILKESAIKQSKQLAEEDAALQALYKENLRSSDSKRLQKKALERVRRQQAGNDS